MVEARFSCWFCLRYECTLRCLECNQAPYCSEYCMLRDLHRHKQLECIHFSQTTMCALCRKVLFAPTIDCQQCYSVTYCSTDCCKAHTSAHSAQCLNFRQEILVNAKKRGNWAQTKLASVPPYIGHTPALDYLQLRHNEGLDIQDLNLLLISFSDVRSVVKTVVDLPADFNGGVRFVLHENRPHLMARNLIFIYLAIANPWPQCMTQIWYSTKLTEKCLRYLNAAIGTLTEPSGYEKLINTTRELVHVTREQWLTCCKVWVCWQQFGEAHPIRTAKWADRQRHRRMGSWALSPSAHQRKCTIPLCYQQSYVVWFEDGLLLPLRSVERAAASRPNPTLFCLNPCKSGCVESDTERYPELRSSRVSLQLAEIVDGNDNAIYGVPSNDNVFACWDYIQVKAATGSHFNGDLLEMYVQYINTVFYSFCKVLSRGTISFRLLDCEISEIATKLSENGERCAKMDRICIVDAEESLNTIESMSELRPTLNTTNSHALFITHHELWYDANDLDRCGNMSLREPALLLSRRDVDGRPYVLEQVEMGKSDCAGRFWSCSDDYLDAWPLVYRHLQAEIFEFCVSVDEKKLKKTLNVEEFVRQLGFHLKFFFREHHSVVPFRFQSNIRRVSMQRANFVSLEWKPIPVLSAAQ